MPEIWDKLNTDYSIIFTLTWRIQRYPDLDVLSEAQLTEFLNASELSCCQKGELKASSDHNRRYEKFIFWHRLDKAVKAYADFHNFSVVKGIFIPPRLQDHLDTLSNMMNETLEESRFEREHPIPRAGRFAKIERFHREGPALLDDIRGEVQRSLYENRIDSEVTSIN